MTVHDRKPGVEGRLRGDAVAQQLGRLAERQEVEKGREGPGVDEEHRRGEADEREQQK